MKDFRFDTVTNFILGYFKARIAWHNETTKCYKFQNKEFDSLLMKRRLNRHDWLIEHVVDGMTYFGMAEDFHDALEDLIAKERSASKSSSGIMSVAGQEKVKAVRDLLTTADFLYRMKRDKIRNKYGYTGD